MGIIASRTAANAISTCALLQVPLDYSNASIGTTDLAIIKAPGDTPDAQEVLVNPGGPGGSSVDMILGDMKRIQEKISTKYALVGIDPRGIKDSGPPSDCFPGYSPVARNAFFVDVFQPADVYHEYELKTTHQSILEYGKWCSQVYSVNGTARYAGTVATAQDMLHYIELRAKDLGKKAEAAKLWFYGISYGSVLGTTFAALYPDRVERMIIDGDLDLEDNYNGGWETATVDSDAAARFWFKRCFEAGPNLCEFHQNATSWEELEHRYWKILYKLKDSPIGLGNPLSELAETGTIITPNVLTWQAVASQMFSASYVLAPVYYAALDTTLVELETGNYSLVQAISVAASISSVVPAYDDRMARTLVACLDANRRSNYTEFDDYKSFVYAMNRSSIYGGLSIASYSGPICSQLDVSPPESQIFDGKPSKPLPVTFQYPNHIQVCPISMAKEFQYYL